MLHDEEKARAFALMAHRDQKYGTEPYAVHLAAVRQVLADFGITNPYLLQAAWLHDTIEDTTVTWSDIAREFGSRVADLVWAVSGFGSTRKQRNLNAYSKIQNFPNPWAAALKTADRIANVEASQKNRPDLFEMYAREQGGFCAMMGSAKFLTTKVGFAMYHRLEAPFDEGV